MKYFNYLVISKGGILTHGREKCLGMSATVTSFAVALSAEMAPSCKIIAYHVTADGEVLADMLTLPIKGISREELTLGINRKQDRTGNLIELVPLLGLGSIIGLSAHDIDTIGKLHALCLQWSKNNYVLFAMFVDVQGFNEITPPSALLELYRHVRGKHKKLIHKNNAGRNERAIYFPTANNARETESTFAFADLIVFTNLNMTRTANYCNQNYRNLTIDIDGNYNQHREVKETWLPCLSGGCYPIHNRCDGIRHCLDNR